MSAPMSRRIAQIFSEAEAMRPEDRGTFLRQACAGDDDLRREVAALLTAASVCEGYFSELSKRLAGTWSAMTRRKPS